MAMMAAAAPYLMGASMGMSILGSVNQSNAQREAGQVAYQNALMRNQAAQTQADQEQVAAGQELASGQRQMIQQRTRGQVMAGRARAVMAASGAGVDPNLEASLIGEGDYAGDVATYNAGEKARADMNQAAMTRYGGQAGVWSGTQTMADDNRAADSTLIGGIAKAGLSFASYYGGRAFGGGDVADPYLSASPQDQVREDILRESRIA